MAECGNLDIISGRKAVCRCSFHNAVDHRAGLCIGRRVAEQPVLFADSKGTYLVFCTVGGLLLHGVLLAASLYFSDCSQKYIFMVLFSHFGESGERHGFIRRFRTDCRGVSYWNFWGTFLCNHDIIVSFFLSKKRKWCLKWSGCCQIDKITGIMSI